jgi:hypothetical protein
MATPPTRVRRPPSRWALAIGTAVFAVASGLVAWLLWNVARGGRPLLFVVVLFAYGLLTRETGSWYSELRRRLPHPGPHRRDPLDR